MSTHLFTPKNDVTDATQLVDMFGYELEEWPSRKRDGDRVVLQIYLSN